VLSDLCGANALHMKGACRGPACKLTVLFIQDSLFRLWSEGGHVTPMYRAQLRVLAATLCPEGVPGFWMPSAKQMSAVEAAEPPEGWLPQGNASDEAIRRGAWLRGQVWSGALSCVETAAYCHADSEGGGRGER
jgi:hypothetical protein